VTRYSLVPDRYGFIVGKDFESNANVFHFLGNPGSPKGIAIKLVQGEGLVDSLRQLNAKLMGPFKITGLSLLYEGNDPISLRQDIRYPPIKGSFMVNANKFSIFGCFNWVRLFEVGQVLPGGGTILPLAA
jgi:hypothetical protein